MKARSAGRRRSQARRTGGFVRGLRVAGEPLDPLELVALPLTASHNKQPQGSERWEGALAAASISMAQRAGTPVSGKELSGGSGAEGP